MQTHKIHLLAQSVRRLLRRSAFEHVTNLLSKLRPGDISHIMLELGELQQRRVFALLIKQDKDLAGQTLTGMGLDPAIALLAQFSAEEAAGVLQELESDDAAQFISALPEERAGAILDLMATEESAEVQGLLEHEAETAGRIMTPNVLPFREVVTVGEAIHSIQTTEDLAMSFYVYVVDERSHLVGIVSLRELLMVPPSTFLRKIMTTDILSVRTDTDQEEVARQVALYDLLAIPVVDEENKLVGVITVDDVIDVIKEEATEDIFYMAGVESDDRIYTPPRKSVRKRLPWLLINLVTALMAATIVAFYEPTIARFSYLAVFLPVVAGMGGNSGTQTLTVIVRGLALGEATWKSSRAALGKELAVALTNGIVLGLLCGAVAFAWKGSFELGFVLGGALIINILVAGIIGTLIPLFLIKLNVDPAVASSIILTTFTDMVGFLSFLGLATYFLVGVSPS
jgi:magnesium transporter